MVKFKYGNRCGGSFFNCKWNSVNRPMAARALAAMDSRNPVGVLISGTLTEIWIPYFFLP